MDALTNPLPFDSDKLPLNREFRHWLAFCEDYYLTGARRSASHDLGHIRRVLNNAFSISANYEIDDVVLLISVYFHDYVSYAKNSRDDRSEIDSAAFIDELFASQLSGERILKIKESILAHRFSKMADHGSIESMILFDADKLDALGAIGIARLFCVAGELGSEIYDLEDPVAAKRNLDDKSYALDHFYTKLFLLPDIMQTPVGRALAITRTGIMRDFINSLQEEIKIY